MSQRQKRISLTGIVLIAIAALTVLTLTLVNSGPSPTAAAQQAPTPKPLTGREIALTLARVGCTPDSLAAVGFDPGSVAALFTSAAAKLQTDITLIREADALCLDARRSEHDLARMIARGKGTRADVTLLQQTRLQVAQADAERDALLDQVLASVSGLLSPPQQVQLKRIKANRGHGLPTEYLAANRTDQEWAALRDALNGERIAAEWDEPLAREFGVALSAARANPDTQAASANLSTRLSQMKVQFDQQVAARTP